MEHMRNALYSSLSSQWAAQQKRESEIAALAHDLKTPLTLIGGNAELLLDEELPPYSRKKVETIAAGNDRAMQYVAVFTCGPKTPWRVLPTFRETISYAPWAMWYRMPLSIPR